MVLQVRPVQLINLVDGIFYDFLGGTVGKNNKIIVNLGFFKISVAKIANFFCPSVYKCIRNIFQNRCRLKMQIKEMLSSMAASSTNK